MTGAMFFLGSRRRGGRPPRFGVRATERVQFTVTPDQLQALEIVAKENDLKLVDVVRDAVNSYVADYSDRAGPFAKAMRRD